MTRDIDVSTVVTLHREGKYLARTLRSLSEAATFAADSDLRTELVAAFDRSDPLTREVFRAADLSAFRAVRVIEANHGSVSLSRNAGCRAAMGEWLDLIDGDDLTSYCSIARMAETGRERGAKCVLVPKFSLGFGGKYYTVEYFSQDDIAAFATVKYPLFTSKVFYHRSLHDVVQYRDVPLGMGYAYEDWHFNCEAMSAGYSFFSVEGTALLYRQRLDSRNHAADRISARQPPPSMLFKPSRFRQVFTQTIARYSGPNAAPLPHLRGFNLFKDPVYRAIIARANAIDPAVDIGRYEWDCLGHFSNAIDARVGIAYYRMCEAVASDEFEEVFLLSSDTTSGPVMDSLLIGARASPGRSRLALFDYVPGDGWQDGAPGDAAITPVFLPALCAELTVEDRDLLCFKLIQATAESATLQFAADGFGRRFFSTFAPVLDRSHSICYRPANRVAEFAPGYPSIDPVVFDFLSEHAGAIDRVICADIDTLRDDRRRLGLAAEKWELA
jgi:glycosyltransferase involved in cell wall biosynthesis